MGEEEKTISLRDAIEQGFNRVEQEEAQQGAAPGAEPAPDAAPVGNEAPAQAEAPAPAPAQNPAPVPEVMGQQAPAPAPQTAPVQQKQDPLQEMAAMNQYLIQRAQQLEAQIQQMQGTVQQQSQLAQQTIDTAAQQPTIEIPILDFNEMQYDDDATRAEKMQAWQNAMIANIKDEVTRQRAGELEPIIQDWQQKQRIAAEEAAKAQIWADSRFADFKDNDAQIQQIIAANKEFDGMDANRRYLLAGLAARGLNQSQQQAPTAEQIAEMYRNSPDAQRIIDAERARAIADRNNQIPTIQPSSGLSTANAIPDEAPKTKDDLWRQVEARLGGR
jgi:hypothetical protein